MRLVLTLLARNEADVIDANISFHLDAGVDFVIATDNRSDDGTTKILEAYEREGRLRLIREQGTDMRQGEWVTRMARLAAREHGADWVIHGDADEFYWPRGGNLKEVLSVVPDRFGALRTFVRTFLLRPQDDRPFWERMTVRLSAVAPVHDPASIFRPGSKVIHRGHPDIVLGDGTHALQGAPLPALRGYSPIELLHFPFRTIPQTEAKFVRAWEAWTRNPNRPPPHYYAKAYSAIHDGRIGRFLDSLVVDDAVLAHGLADGSLVVDTRVRNALREIGVGNEDSGYRARPAERLGRLSGPDLDEEVRYGAETGALEEADVVRLQRRIDQLETRVRSLELGAGAHDGDRVPR